MTKFGDIVKQVRIEKNLSYVRLEKISGISKRQIQRIENSDNVEGKLNTLQALSNSLEVDLVEYAMVFSDFRDFNEYKDYIEIRKLIENRKYSELIHFLDKFQHDCECGNYSLTFKRLLLYGRSVIELTNTKNYVKVLNYCYKALNVTAENFSVNSVKQYIFDDISFNVLSQIESCYFCLGRTEVALKLADNLLREIEFRYFNHELPKTKISNIIFRVYIALINNISYSNFLTGNYDKSLEYCNKALLVLNRYDNCYILSIIYMVMCENYYMTEQYFLAEKMLNRAIANSIAHDDFEYVQKFKSKVAKSYPKLASVKILTILDDL